jgi:hypothetical protein
MSSKGVYIQSADSQKKENHRKVKPSLVPLQPVAVAATTTTTTTTTTTEEQVEEEQILGIKVSRSVQFLVPRESRSLQSASNPHH